MIVLPGGGVKFKIFKIYQLLTFTLSFQGLKFPALGALITMGVTTFGSFESTPKLTSRFRCGQ